MIPTAEWILDTFRHGGWFVEAGAHDGVGDSQTKALEDAGWLGICVEPSSAYTGLENSRNCCVDSRPLSGHGGPVTFREVGDGNVELSGVPEHFGDHWNRGRWPHRDSVLQSVTLPQLLKDHGAPIIVDFLSLDTEGSELEILRGHDWNVVFLAIQVEHNGVEDKKHGMRRLLLKEGYELLEGDEVNDRFLCARLGMFKHVELEINTACDLACFACDRMSDVTTAPNMTVAQVRRFVDESLELGWEWERIRLLGGEPTLHPQFVACCQEILRYRERFPQVFLQVLSNGLGKYNEHLGFCRDNGISLHVEAKSPGQEPPWFTNTRLVVADDPNAGAVPPCSIFGMRGCGVALTRHGFFLDGAGASAARVAGHDIGEQSLKGVTWLNMLKQARTLCRVCGHWNATSGPLRTRKVSDTGLVVGKYWQETLAAYNRQKPVLGVYGA